MRDLTVSPTLQTTVAGIAFPNVLLNASGAFNPHLFHRLTPLKTALGGIVTKTVTQDPLAGNPQARTVELPGIGMLNSIGLQNPGLSETLESEIPALHAYELPVILSISANSSQAFARMAEAVQAHPSGASVAALELNLSCPNVAKGGVHFGSEPELVREALSAVTSVFEKPVFAKLTPNVGNIAAIGGAAIEGGAVGLTAINTLLGVAIDIRRKKPALPRVSAGYSGPGIKPVALHAVWTLRKHFPETPILGVGGLSSVEDVLEFLMAGASMVQLGTACFRHPGIFREITLQLEEYCRSENLSSLSDLVGCAHAG